MAFQAGHKKLGGRKKGTPNKDTFDAEEIARELGFNPMKILAMFATNDWKGLGYDARTTTRYTQSGESYEVDIISPEIRITATKEAASYLMPKRKATEITVKSETEREAETFDALTAEQQAQVLEAEAKRLRGQS
jgi:hypothetical protein